MARARAGTDPSLPERFTKALVITAKAVEHYPSSSSEPVKIAKKAADLLAEILRARSELRLTFTADGVRAGGEPVFADVGAYAEFARSLADRGVCEARFRAGTTSRDLVAFLSVLACPVGELAAAGGAEARLWERAVSAITVSEAEDDRYSGVPHDAGPSEKAGRGEPPQGPAGTPPSDAPVMALMSELAEETDPQVRRRLVEQLSHLAADHVAELGEYVNDRRWYVVRNVVCILGAANSAESVPYLRLALRHGEPRVRRESVRALSRVHDSRARRLLVEALDDADAHTVQLAARYLGQGRAVEAVGALSRVAAGEGRGNRDTGPRTEAIEALGEIGSAQAEHLLEALATKRLARGEGRALKTSAIAALARVRQSAPGSKEQPK